MPASRKRFTILELTAGMAMMMRKYTSMVLLHSSASGSCSVSALKQKIEKELQAQFFTRLFEPVSGHLWSFVETTSCVNARLGSSLNSENFAFVSDTMEAAPGRSSGAGPHPLSPTDPGFPLHLTNKIPWFFQVFKVFFQEFVVFFVGCVYPFSKTNKVKSSNFLPKKNFW